MIYLVIATTAIFSIMPAIFPHYTIPAAIMACVSYLVWGIKIYSDKRFEKKTPSLDKEIQELNTEFEKAQLRGKIAELNRHTAIQEDRFVKKQKQNEEFSRGIQW